MPGLNPANVLAIRRRAASQHPDRAVTRQDPRAHAMADPEQSPPVPLMDPHRCMRPRPHLAGAAPCTPAVPRRENGGLAVGPDPGLDTKQQLRRNIPAQAAGYRQVRDVTGAPHARPGRRAAVRLHPDTAGVSDSCPAGQERRISSRRTRADGLRLYLGMTFLYGVAERLAGARTPFRRERLPRR